MVAAVSRKQFAGTEDSIVIHPDKTMALLPAWMSTDDAASATLTMQPCLPLARLAELGTQLNSLQAPPGGESSPQGGRGNAMAAATVKKNLSSPIDRQRPYRPNYEPLCWRCSKNCSARR
jgi:hypothetical protein